MPQKFIFVGPIDGLYHICYKIPASKQYASYETCEDKGLAERRASALNALAHAEDKFDARSEAK